MENGNGLMSGNTHFYYIINRCILLMLIITVSLRLKFLEQVKANGGWKMNNRENLKKDLIRDTVENYKVCLRIVKSSPKIVSMVSLQYLPYLSLNVLDMIGEFKLNDVDKHYDLRNAKFSQLLHASRNVLKTGTDNHKYNKVLKNLEHSIKTNYENLTKDYNFIQRLGIKIVGQKDLAVFSYNGIPFLNNIQHEQFINQFRAQQNEISSEDIINFSSSVTNIMTLFLKTIISTDEILDSCKSVIEEPEIHFDMNDYFLYEETRSDLFLNKLSREQNTFLFNLLCQVNTVKFIYPEVLKLKGNTMLRFKYIVYLTLVKGIWIYNQENNLTISIKELINSSDNLFKDDKNRKNFRNNIFHYDIPKNAQYRENVIDTLVEHYLGIENSEFEKHVDYCFEIFLKEVNIILFGEQKIFRGSNVS